MYMDLLWLGVYKRWEGVGGGIIMHSRRFGLIYYGNTPQTPHSRYLKGRTMDDG